MKKSKILQTEARDFHLRHTLECGQFFRLRLIDGWYYINSRNKFFKVRQRDDVIEFQGVNPEYIRHFFSLDEPLDKILCSISREKHIENAVKKYYGLRIIRQDPWECLISYICSSASNIPRIRSCVERIAEKYGEETSLDGIEGNTFPGPDTGCDRKGLEKVRLGFRLRYVLEAGKRVDDPYLNSLRDLPYADAKKMLLQIDGVGDKVADCVLLFSLGFSEAFPVDRWIKRVMQDMYFKGRPTPNKAIHAFAREHFGPHAGYAQEYLYLYSRHGKGID